VLKIATFAKPETVVHQLGKANQLNWGKLG
jgi:hypothetical protein